MCKKRRYFIKTKTQYAVLFYLFLLFFVSTEAAKTQNLTQQNSVHSLLNTAIIERDFDALWGVRKHSDPSVSNRASMALLHAEPANSDWVFEQIIISESPKDWILLSHTNQSADRLKQLHKLFSEHKAPQEFACEVFYRQGNDESLQLLLQYYLNESIDERCAIALGGLLTRVEASEKDILSFLDIFERSTNQQVKRNILYGFFRSDLNRPDPGGALHGRMVKLFFDHIRAYPISLIDEYFVRALGADGVEIALTERSDKDLEENLQLSVELAKELTEVDKARNLKSYSERLIQHPNVHVRVQLLESLKESNELSDELRIILENQLNLETDNPEILITYLELLHRSGHDVSGQINSLKIISNENPYLINRVFSLMQTVMDQTEYVNVLLENLSHEGIKSYRATEALGDLLQTNQLDDERRATIKKKILDQIFQKNRSVLSPAIGIFSTAEICRTNVQKLTELYLSEYNKPASGFSSELSRLLAEVAPELHAGLPEPERKPFRKPDLNRLNEIGVNPTWVLETNRGEIRIRIYPDQAPFTVSSVDSLTRSGAYNDIAFHRVVRNFVIQGGDFDRNDGFGGPSYRIPTEPSAETFSRGKVGIASSGPDTEGSQFFITHTWAPHLDGLYTIFGEVIQGMDVVDRIQIGDRLITARIE